jgi:hypothetical protein
MKNQVQLITYVDRLSGGGFRALNSLLGGQLAGLFGGAHVLPFFTPIDGADAGFDPVDHTRVDDRMGSWEDVLALSSTVELVADLIVNHVSSASPQFVDFSQKGTASKYAGMFLTFERVFPEGARESDLLGIYYRHRLSGRNVAYYHSGYGRSRHLILKRCSHELSGCPQTHSGRNQTVYLSDVHDVCHDHRFGRPHYPRGYQGIPSEYDGCGKFPLCQYDSDRGGGDFPRESG